MPDEAHVFDAEGARRIVKTVRAVEGEGADLSRPGGRGPRAPTYHFFAARIAGNTSLGSNQWTYSWVEVEKTSAGYGGWTTRDEGRSGTDDAYNRAEDMNDGADLEGNGVDVDGADFPAGFAVQPAPTGSIVLMEAVHFPLDGEAAVEYWFTHENAIDGTCEAP